MARSPQPIRVVATGSAPAWAHEPERFQDLVAEQLRHAPWLALSCFVHALLLFLLYLFLPVDRPAAQGNAVLWLPEAPQPAEPPPPPELPPPEREPVEIEPELQDVVTVDELQDVPADAAESVAPTPTAFDAEHWNSAVGIGGGAGPKYEGRTPGRRGGPRGGAPERTIRLALEWLQRHQDQDGRWDADGFMKHDVEGPQCDGAGNAVHDVGVTGLALLAFLGDGSTLRGGPFRDGIRRAVQWLRAEQRDNGLFGAAAASDFVYGHAIATYAMCEAYGLSNYSTLLPTVQNGIAYLESHRNPYSVWRYQPRDNDNDTSVTGWCIMAYESAKDFGLQVNDNALRLAAVWLDEVTDATGRAGYTRAGERSSRHAGDHGARFPPERGEALTAVSLFCRFFMGQDPRETPQMRGAAALIRSRPPVWDERSGAIDHYYWYYATYAMYQAGGSDWAEWSKQIAKAIVPAQRKDGNFAGSWDPVGVWGEDGGRVYSTAILALTLQAHFRYSKLVR